MNIYRYRIRLFLCFFAGFMVILPFFSCAARINGSLSADGSAALSVSVSLEPRITSLIQRLSAVGGQADAPILDGTIIAQSMSESGIVMALFRNTAPAAIEGTIQISDVSRFLTFGDRGGFIDFEQSGSGGSFAVTINRYNGPIILEILSPEIAAYLNALMAPLATGEELTKAEYLELVGSIYNRAISDEIAGARVRASIDFPGTVTSVNGGTFSGRRADFDILLLDLLVLETPVNYEVQWR